MVNAVEKTGYAKMIVSFKEGHGIAEGVARKFQGYSKVPFDDLYQEAWIGILTAKKYDETKGKNKKGYLYGAAFNRVSVHVCSFRLVLSGGYFRVKDKLAMMRPEKPEKIYDLIDPVKMATLLHSGQFRAREIAELLGIEITKVYSLTKATKKNIKNSEPLRKICEE